MRKIKFSHVYEKMPEDLSINILTGIFISNTKDLGKFFKDYNTGWSDGIEYSKSTLPKGKIVVLLFNSGINSELWTTIIRWTPQKERYYRKAIDCEFEVEILK